MEQCIRHLLSLASRDWSLGSSENSNSDSVVRGFFEGRPTIHVQDMKLFGKLFPAPSKLSYIFPNFQEWASTMYFTYLKSLKYFNSVWEVSGDDREFELWFRIWKWLSLACHMKSHAGSPSIWRVASGSITQMSRPEALLVNSFNFNHSELVPSS